MPDQLCVYCGEPMMSRADGRLAHDECIDTYGCDPPEDFMRGEDGYARVMAWEAGNRAER